MQEKETGRTYLVAENQTGEVVGVIGFTSPEARMYRFKLTARPVELVNAYVKQDERGGGVGRALVAELEKRAKDQDYTEVLLNSGPRYKGTGWGFYERVGYTRVGVMKNRYGKGAHAPVWRKAL